MLLLHIPPKHVLHRLALPMLPNTAPGAGSSGVPQVNQAHLVVRVFTDVMCATFLRAFTTACADLPSSALVVILGPVASIFVVLVLGVIGAAATTATGVGGVGNCPSVAGFQPVLIASVIFERVCSSETHAALSYRYFS